MKYATLLLLALVKTALAATLTITPDPAFECSNGLARVTLNWTGASGLVQIRMNDPKGSALTGFELPSGSATTGQWVGDRMPFYLVNQSGVVEATATAHVQCGGSARDSYFPLEIGNTWVFRASSRQYTSIYVTWTVTGSEEIGGRTYMRVRVEPGDGMMRLRGDAQGRILYYADTGDGLLFDPAAPGSTFGSYNSAIGVFTDTISQRINAVLSQTLYVYARGVGLVHSDSTMLTGSSGGFTGSMDLVEARLAGGFQLSVRAPTLSVSAESARLDVTGKKVTNCAVPCYFAACGLVPGADPPGTYKPCMQSRIHLSDAAPSSQIVVELRDATDRVVAQASPLGADGNDRVQYVQLPLYVTPNQPFPPGAYKIVGRLFTGTQETGSASYAIRID